MSENIEHNCCNCEWLVKVRDSKACNAFAVPTDNVNVLNSCSDWEKRDDKALEERNKHTAQQVTYTIPDKFGAHIARQISLGIDYRPSYHQFPTRVIISDDYLDSQRHYFMPRARELTTEELQGQQELNKIHEIIHKIQRQKDYIRNRFDIVPTQIVMDSRTLRKMANCREVQHNISYGHNNRKYWQDLEIIECRPIDENPMVEVLFINTKFTNR